MIEVININATDCLSDYDCDNLRGKYLDGSHFNTIIDYDCDFLCEGKPVFKFRKKQFQEDLLRVAWDNCKNMAKVSRGRGAASGPIDPESTYWKKRDIYWSKKWSAMYMVKDRKTGEMKRSKMKVQNEVASNPIGFYGKTNGLGLDLPCRLSHYTRDNFEDYERGIPYFQKIAENYQKLMPDQFIQQLERANMNEFHIPGTPFSTITVNRNFRTAAHKDSGDFGGWACLSVLEENKYHGGLFVLPKFKVAIDIRHGDILVADVHQYHGNTELFETEEDKKYNDENIQTTFKDNLSIGVLGLNNRFSRLSFVSYLRENMIECQGLNKYVISLNDSKRREQWVGTEYKIFDAVDGSQLAYDCEACDKIVSYHNIRLTPRHLAKTGCFLSHLNLLRYIAKNKIDRALIVEDDALQINRMPEKLPTDCLTYLGGFIGNKKITSKEKIEINHKIGLNTLNEKYRMVCCLAYYIPKWEIAGELYKKLMALKRWRAIDISLPNLLEKTNYIYPAVYIEECGESQIMEKKVKFANEYYKQA